MEWPDAKEESAYLSEAASRGEVSEAVRERVAAPVVGENLHGLERAVEQVPEEVRTVLDELFRARFVAVRRFNEPSGGA